MECKATTYIADDYGDNQATIHCQLDEGHDGPHREICRNGKLKIEWEDSDYEA